MSYFFKASPEIYEQIRISMDQEHGLPSDYALTWFTPAVEAPKDVDGNCLIGCIDPICERFRQANCEELTESQYFDAIVASDLLQAV